MALKLNSVWLFLFITTDKYIRILLMPKCTMLLTYCCLHAVEYSPDVASTLDRIKLSDRKFVLLAAAIAKANDDLSTAPLSHSTVYHKRSSHRSEIASDVHQKFMLTEKAALVVHWDGNIMKDSTNHEDPKSTAETRC